MNLSNYEIESINQIFDNIFTIERRKVLLQELDSETYIILAINGNNPQMIYEMFDNAFALEDKIDFVIKFYERYGHKFEDIKILLQNRDLLIFNHYNSDWRKREKNNFYNQCYKLYS